MTGSVFVIAGVGISSASVVGGLEARGVLHGQRKCAKMRIAREFTMTPTNHRQSPLLLATFSLLLAACGSKDAGTSQGEAAKSEAKADAKSVDASEAGDTAKPDAKPAAGSAAAPGGRTAAGNLAPIVEALAGVEVCKLDERGENLEGDCPGFDKFLDLIDAREDDKAVGQTVVNLLGDANDTVRWSAADVLNSIEWAEDPALVSTVLVALGTEKQGAIARILADATSSVELELLSKAPTLAVLTRTMSALVDVEAFASVIPSGGDFAGYDQLLVTVAKQNPTLENRAYAVNELLDLDTLHAETCSVALEVITAMSKAKAVDPDSDEFPVHNEANGLIYELGQFEIGEGEKVQDCAAVLPGLIDEAQAQAKAGSLNAEVFEGVLDIDQREDAKTYMPKLQALAEAVAAGSFDESMKADAADAIADWKAE